MNIQATLLLTLGLAAGAAQSATEIVVATVNNGHMITIQGPG